MFAAPAAILTCLFALALALALSSVARGSDDVRDLPFVLDAVNDALETARTNVDVPWENPATGNSGVIVVERTFYPSPETPCRQYRRTFNRPDEVATMTRGTGCRVGPGRWKIEEERTATQVPKAPKSGPSPETPAEPPSPIGGTPSGPPSAPKTAPPSETAKPPARPPSTAAKAAPKPPPPSAAPTLPKFTMPSKAEI